MGFFSWNCKKCGMAIMSPYSVDKKTAWLNDAVVLTKDGSIYRGEYDGYGRINDNDIDGIDYGEAPEMYHRACWERAGRPTEFTEASESARNQGYFIGEEDPEWTATKPLT